MREETPAAGHVNRRQGCVIKSWLLSVSSCWRACHCSSYLSASITSLCFSHPLPHPNLQTPFVRVKLVSSPRTTRPLSSPWNPTWLACPFSSVMACYFLVTGGRGSGGEQPTTQSVFNPLTVSSTFYFRTIKEMYICVSVYRFHVLLR